MSSEASAESGSWNTSRAEYQRGIMDAVKDPTINRIVIMAGAQVGKTEMLLNVVGYHIAHDPAPILVVNPNLQMSDAFSKDRLAPMLRDTPALRGKVKDPRSRDSNNTTKHKTFPGGHISLVGAESPAGLASRPIRIVLFDEVDRYVLSAGSEGDPIQLASKRTATFHNRKIIMVSTPTIKGASRIEDAFEETDKRHFLAKCPDSECGHEQVLKWAKVKFNSKNPDTAEYQCEECGLLWNDAQRNKAVRNGRWQATGEFKGSAGFFINGLYSPWMSLADAVREFLSSSKNPQRLRVFVNTYLAETWEDEGEKIDDVAVKERVEKFGSLLDSRILLITGGVDVQDDRVEVELVGWGKGQESWSISYDILYGDPSTPQLWKNLLLHLQQTFETEDGRTLNVNASCVDSQGHFTTAVYKFCKQHYGRGIYAIKGMGGEDRAMVSRPTTNNKYNCKLFTLGVDSIKTLLFSRLSIQSEGEGYCHFPNDRSDEYFKQLAASEVKKTKYERGAAKRFYQQIRPRNEALDCRVYAMGALEIRSVDLDRLAKVVEESSMSKKDQKSNLPERSRRKRSNFATGWR